MIVGKVSPELKAVWDAKSGVSDLLGRGWCPAKRWQRSIAPPICCIRRILTPRSELCGSRRGVWLARRGVRHRCPAGVGPPTRGGWSRTGGFVAVGCAGCRGVGPRGSGERSRRVRFLRRSARAHVEEAYPGWRKWWRNMWDVCSPSSVERLGGGRETLHQNVLPAVRTVRETCGTFGTPFHSSSLQKM